MSVKRLPYVTDSSSFPQADYAILNTDEVINMHILLVEDDSAITMGLDYTLKKEGYTVCICMSVEQARAALSKQRFDLALIDLSLPDGSGFDLCEPARAQGAAVIFLTASDDEMCVVKGLDMGR